VVLSNTFKLADRHKTDLRSLVSLAFMAEDEPYFDGFRTLATHGIDKPVMNFFRMAGLMRGERVKVESTGALGLEAILQNNVRGAPDIDALAARSDDDITIMVWNYHDDDVPAPDAPIRMTVNGIPKAVTTARLNHYRIDKTHSNSFTAWNEMGSPQNPTPDQYARMEAAGRLELLESPRWLRNDDGKAEISFMLPRHGLSLLQISW
jgi:xylan 1,4-beta-xylosidase